MGGISLRSRSRAVPYNWILRTVGELTNQMWGGETWQKVPGDKGGGGQFVHSYHEPSQLHS